MRILIVGGGRMGRGLAKRFEKTGDDLVVIDVSEERAYELTNKLDATVIYGDGTDPDILKKADIERVDALVVVTSSDEVNLMVCKLGKDFGVPRIIARVNEGDNMNIFEDVGADVTINSILATLGLFERAVNGPEIYGLLSLGGYKAEAIEVTVGGNSEAFGKTIEELNIPELCTVAMIIRKGELIPPRGDTEFKENDHVILVGDSNELNSISKTFSRSNS